MKRPDVSIIMSCHNEAEILPHSISAAVAQAQTVPNSELLVVVNGSTDRSLEVANDFADEYTKVIEVEIPGKKNAMNIGMLAAKSDALLFVDADSFMPENAALQALEALGADGTYVVGAAREPLYDTNKLNIDFPTTFYALSYARRAARTEHSTVQGWFMALNKPAYSDDFQFPPGASADDIWLSAYTGTMYGSGSVGYLESLTGKYIPPDNIEDMTTQAMRHRAGHLVVKREHPQLSGFFDNLKKHYVGLPSNDEQWRQAALERGIDFDTWIVKYAEFTDSIDQSIRNGTYVDELLAMGGLWERVSSTKNIDTSLL